MNKETFIQVFRFISLVLAQGLVFMNIELFDGSMQLYPYILVIILLPFRTPPLVVMGVSFLLGLCVDMFYVSPGVHASACVLVGFVRGKVLELLAPRDGYDIKDRPSVGSLGIVWFIQYAFLIVLVHHCWFFVIESFRIDALFSSFGKALLSALFTFLVLLIGQFLFHRNKRSIA